MSVVTHESWRRRANHLAGSLRSRAAIFATITSLLLAGIVVWAEWAAYDAQLNESKASLTNLATALIRDAEDKIALTDSAVAGVVRDLEQSEVSTSSLHRISMILPKRIAELPDIGLITVVGADGHWLATTQPTAGGDVSGRDYFKLHRNNPSAEPIITGPVKSLLTGQWVVIISRRFRSADGGFGGVVIGVVDASRFAKQQAEFDLGPGSFMGLFSTSGKLVATFPSDDAAIGRDMSNAGVFAQPKNQLSGNYEATSILHGTKRLAGYRRSQRYPFVAAAAMSKSQALAPWRTDALKYCVFALISIGCVWLLGLNLADLFARKQALLSRLRQSEQFLERTGHMAGVGGWELDLASKRVYWTTETYRFFGVKPEFAPTLEATLAFYETDARDIIRTAVTRCISAGLAYDLELAFVRADGARRWSRATGAITYLDGKPSTLTGGFQDVTEQVDARRAIQIAHERVTFATSNGRIGVFEIDGDRTTVRWDASMYRLFGSEPGKELTSYRFWIDRIHSDDRAAADVAMASAIGKSDPFETEFRIVWPNGAVRHIHVAGRMMLDAIDEAPRLAGVSWDVTELRELAAKLVRQSEVLAQSEENFRLMAQNSSDMISRIGPDGERRYVSPASVRLFGLPPEELIDRGLMEFVHPDDSSAVKALHARLISSANAEGKVSFRINHPDRADVWVEATARSVPDSRSGEPDGWVSAMRDVTERVRLEKDRDARESELRKANKDLERLAGHLAKTRDEANQASRAKSEFLATMSHEIRSPMSGLLGVLELLSESPLAPAQAGMMKMARNSAMSLLAVLNDILDFSKIEAEQISISVQPTCLSDLVNDIVSPRVIEATRKGIGLTMNIGKDVPEFVETDPLRLKQILNNLLSNAIKFTAVGEVDVHLDIEGAESAPKLRFTVRDSGIGMSEKVQARLFSPFMQADSTTSRDFGGTGLGLCISRRLAELLGGSLDVASQIGIGSTFTLLLPSIQATKPTVEGKLVGSPSLPQAFLGRLALVVDDDPTIRWLSQRHLERLGMTVDVAENGEAALAMLRQQKCDLVLTDCHMPRMDGAALARAVRAENDPALRRITIVGLTADVTEAQRKRCLDAGMDDIATKPVTREQLSTMLLRFFSSDSKDIGGDLAQLDANSQPMNTQACAFDPATYYELFEPGEREGDEWLAEFLDGSKSLLERIMVLLSAVVPFGPGELSCCRSEISSVAHRLAGTALSVGARPLGESARDLEHAALQEGHVDLRSRLNKIQAALSMVEQEIAAFTAILPRQATAA